MTRLLLSLLLLCSVVHAERKYGKTESTRIGLPNGTSLPATCAVGEVFFKSDESAGQNMHICTATDTWTKVNGSFTVASQAEAEAGVENTKGMTALRTKQAIAAQTAAEVVSKFSGSGDYLKTDGTQGTPAGTGGEYTAGPSGLITIDTSGTPDTIDITPGTMPTLAGANAFAGVNEFAILEVPHGNGAPAATGCDEAAEKGRIYLQDDEADTAKRIWACDGSAWRQQGGASGGGWNAGTIYACSSYGTTMLNTTFDSRWWFPDNPLSNPTLSPAAEAYTNQGASALYTACYLRFDAHASADRYAVAKWVLPATTTTAHLRMNYHYQGTETETMSVKIGTKCIATSELYYARNASEWSEQTITVTIDADQTKFREQSVALTFSSCGAGAQFLTRVYLDNGVGTATTGDFALHALTLTN